MDRVKKAGGNITNGYWGEQLGSEPDPQPLEQGDDDVKMTKDGVDTSITIDQLKAHEREDAPWFVINGEVYDGTAFLKEHPGGAQSITAAAGQDATDEFIAIRKLRRVLPRISSCTDVQ